MWNSSLVLIANEFNIIADLELELEEARLRLKRLSLRKSSHVYDRYNSRLRIHDKVKLLTTGKTASAGTLATIYRYEKRDNGDYWCYLDVVDLTLDVFEVQRKAKNLKKISALLPTR